MRVYDMSTGRLVECVSTSADVQPPDFDASAPELQLQLQLVVTESLPERDMPPELVLADLNAFIDEMS
jgi:hypothetical protein